MPSRRVLVVDDDEELRDLASDALERAGFEVISVSSGADALAFLGRESTPTAVVLDLNMDDMNGYEVIGALKRGATRHEVLVVSGERSEAMPPGLRCLRKPFSREQLVEAVRGCFPAKQAASG